MNARERELLDRVASHVLRRPDYPPEPAVERLLTRLNAARGDVDRILLERVIVLEAALAAVREQAAREQAAREREQAAAERPREPVSAPAGTGVGRLLREAAVVAAGVAGGALLVRGVDAAASGLAGLFQGDDTTVAGDDVADPGVDWA